MKTCFYDNGTPVGVIVVLSGPILVCGAPGSPRFHAGIGVAVEPISRYFYRCRHCDELELKERWGPGRITCPSCGKLAPSVIAINRSQFATCPSCGGRSFFNETLEAAPKPGESVETRQPLCCQACVFTGEDDDRPLKFLGFTFCDQPCQSYHKTGEHLLP